MYRSLGSAVLRNGDTVELGFVEGPDPDWMSRLVPFLGHKQPWFEYHIAKALSEPLDGLRTRFYLGTVGEEIVAHIMVVSARRAGILGHVYTVPQWRRQSAITAVMRAQMQDCADLDVVTLSTGYGSAAYGIYHGFGFRSVVDGSGDMQWLARPDVAAESFAPAECTVRAMRWDDWPPYSWATLQDFTGEPAPRSAAFGIHRQGSSEGSFVRIMQSALGHRSKHWILESVTGAVVGWCHLVPGQEPLRGTHLLDLHTLPGFESYLPALLERADWPADPVTFSMSPADPNYGKFLSESGFAVDQRLSEAVAGLRDAEGLEIWIRHG